MSKWVLTIPFVAGEDKKKGLLRINNLMRDSAKAQGFESVPVKPKRPASQLWQQLESTGTEQRVTMEVIQPGQRVNLARARRTFTPEFAETVANYEFATGDDELDAVFQRIMPELSEADLERMSNATSARARAFDASIDSLVGADTKLRNRHINASDKFLKSYIIGHAPARAGATLTENRKRELQDIVKASLGNLGVMDDDMSELLRHRIQSRPILMSQQVEIEFRAMIHAYHEVRKHNAPYIQAMMGGMDGAKDPEGLISALLPSPDDIMRGAIAHIIIDLSAVPSASQAPGFLRRFAEKLFNLSQPVTYIGATDKQKSVGRLLAFHGGRKRMVGAVEKAVNKAQLRGADFIKAFRTHRPANADADNVRNMVQSLYEDDGSFINLKEENMTGTGAFFGGGGSQIFVPPEGQTAEQEKAFIKDMFKTMEKEGLAFPISQFRQSGGQDELGFVILPIELPMFSRRPVGWDRRWMVATMRVVDEYWDFIYSGEGILLSNLLYLIVARAEELFQYTMDSTEITQLAILLSKDSSQFVAPAPAAPGAPAAPAAPASSLDDITKLKIRRTESSLGRMTKADLQDLLDKMGVTYDKGIGARGRGGNTKSELVQKIIDNRSRFARRRSRRGGILPTPKDEGTPLVYRPLKTLSHLVTGQVAQAAAAVQSEEATNEIARLQQEIAVRDRAGEMMEETNTRQAEKIAELSAELAQMDNENDELADHHNKMHTERGEVSHTIIRREEEVLDSESAREEIEKMTNELKELERFATLELGDRPVDQSKIFNEISQANKALAGDKSVIPTLTTTISVIGPLTGQTDKIQELASKVLSSGNSKARRRGRRKNASKLGTIYTEASVPRSRNTAKHIKTAMGDLYADLYKTAKNDFKGADSVENIGIEMINIGDDIFHLVAKADVMSDTKPNPPESHWLSMDPDFQRGLVKESAVQWAQALANRDQKDWFVDEAREMSQPARFFVVSGEGSGLDGKLRVRPDSHWLSMDPDFQMGLEYESAMQWAQALANRDRKDWFVDEHHESPIERRFFVSSKSGNITVSPVKSNPPFGPFKKRKSGSGGKVYAGRFNTLDEITQAMDKLRGNRTRFNAAYKDGNYGTEEEAREKLTTIFYEITDGTELARDIELSLAALTNPPDTCCIICGSCDDPCDCEDNPPKGTFKEKETRTKVKKILRKEGGAAGLEPLRAAFPKGTTKKAIERFIDENIKAVYQHEDGDYILESFGKDSKKKRQYKGHLISKVSTGWMVDAYDQSFKTLKQARDFISKKVAGSATPNQQCVRILKGTNRCKGMVVFIRSKKYKCDGCGAEYREA